MRILKAQLNALVKNKLEDIEAGLGQLDTACEYLGSLRKKYRYFQTGHCIRASMDKGYT